jgi:hypothetical protein
MLLDEVTPTYHFREAHAIDVRASGPAALGAVRSLRPEDARLLTALLSFRNLPARLTGRRPPAWSSESSLLDQLLARGFVVVAAEPDREIVVGVVGRFWTLDAWASDAAPLVGSGEEFLAFDAPGYAKASANFRVQPSGALTRLTTETRIQATDSASRRKFALYWALIRPGSALIRRDLLRAVRRRAEGG